MSKQFTTTHDSRLTAPEYCRLPTADCRLHSRLTAPEYCRLPTDDCRLHSRLTASEYCRLPTADCRLTIALIFLLLFPCLSVIAQTKSQQAAQRKELYGLLGKLPDRKRPIKVQLVSKEETDDIVVERLMLDLNGLEQVPAYFIKPKGSTGKLPIVLFNHSHFGQYNVGKDEFLFGRKEMQTPPYAIALAKQGYAGLCIDAWAFGKRAGRSEQDIFKDMLWKGQVMWGMMVYDNLRALDYLESREDVDMKRVATMGMSMGSTMAWWLAALDERIKVCVDLCCLTDFDELIKENGLSLHGIYYYVPDLRNHFTTSQINALIAPRAHFGLAGRYDPLTPVKGLEKIDSSLKVAYKAAGAPEAWQLKIYEVAHIETAEMRRDILEFLEKWL